MIARKIAEPGVYCLSRVDEEFGISTNSYLIVDEYQGKRECILIDPGSVQGFADLEKYLADSIKPEELRYIVLQHQDPDLCAATPALEKIYPHAQIATHWRSAVLVKHYGVESPFYFVDQNRFSLKLASGRELLFFHTPYAHSPAAIMTYDLASKTLFSGDLFGAFAVHVNQVIDDSYLEAVAIFHENYIPSKEIMNLMIAKVKVIEREFGISIIAPQHGYLLQEEYIQKAINTLTDLECGGYLVDIRKEIISQEQGIRNVVDELIEMQRGVFGRTQWSKELVKLGMLETDLTTVKPQYYTVEGINKLVDITFEKGGHVVVDSFQNRILRLVQSYQLPIPKLFEKSEYKTGIAQITEYINLIGYLSNELTILQDSNFSLSQSMEEIQESINRDALTGLYHQSYFHEFFEKATRKVKNGEIDILSLAVVSIDGMTLINDNYGESFGNRIISNVAAILKDYIEDNNLVFKHVGAQYMVLLPGASLEMSNTILEDIRNHVHEQNIADKKLSVSIGVSEIKAQLKEVDWAEDEEARYYDDKRILKEVLEKLRIARNQGGNRVITDLTHKADEDITTILVADANQITRQVIRNELEDAGYHVIEAEHGAEAIDFLRTKQIHLLVTEVMLPRKDGYYLMGVVKNDSLLKDIPIVVVSSINYGDEVVQALEMGAADYITKPFSPRVLKEKIRKLLER